MLMNLSEYFEPQQEYYLENISYNRKESIAKKEDRSLICTDNITVGLSADSIKITLERTLKFEPEGFFELTVSFSTILKFKADKKNEVEWDKINLAEEFGKNGDFALTHLSSRSSLLIAEITASFGQQPLIIPAGVTKK